MHGYCMPNQAAPEAVASEVRAEMGRQRKTQAELAAVLGIYSQTAARRLDGSVPFDVAELATVSRWLGIKMSDLLARSERAATAGAA